MARQKNEFEKVLLRFKPGTNDRIDAVRGERDRASFVREAIDEKIERETRAQARQRAKPL
jgi:hypothetical protein